MVKLNLPEFDCKIQKKDKKLTILDIIRKKYIVLTPEEWVRQHFLHYLINYLKYPKGLIKTESGLKYNNLLKRSDIVLYNTIGEAVMIVECKATTIKITQEVFDQAACYSKSLNALYLVVTNGLTHICSQLDHENSKYEFLSEIPPYNTLKLI